VIQGIHQCKGDGSAHWIRFHNQLQQVDARPAFEIDDIELAGTAAVEGHGMWRRCRYPHPEVVTAVYPGRW
jgi:hypothetical protein